MTTLHHLSDETIYITFRNGEPLQKGQKFCDFIRKNEFVADDLFIWEDDEDGNEFPIDKCYVKDYNGDVVLEGEELYNKTGRVEIGDDIWEIKTIDDCDDDEIEKVEEEFDWDCDVLAYCAERKGKHFITSFSCCGDDLELYFSNGGSAHINASELGYFDDEDEFREALMFDDDLCEFSANEIVNWFVTIWPNAKFAGEEDDDNE